jgi:hypothetical protein
MIVHEMLHVIGDVSSWAFQFRNILFIECLVIHFINAGLGHLLGPIESRLFFVFKLIGIEENGSTELIDLPVEVPLTDTCIVENFGKANQFIYNVCE